MAPGTRKMPLPMMVPTTIATDALRPRSRTRSDRPFTGSGITEMPGIVLLDTDGHLLRLRLGGAAVEQHAGKISDGKGQRGPDGDVPRPGDDSCHQPEF